MVGKKRLFLAAGTLASIGAVVALATGVTFGFFSDSEQSGSNSFTAGTVSVGAGSPTSVTCSITNMVPGDSSATAPIGSKGDESCTYNVEYTGSAPAFLGVDVAIANGSTTLYDGTNQGLQLYLKDGAGTSYFADTAGNGSSASGNGDTYLEESATPTGLGLFTPGISNLLVSTTAATNGSTVSFTLDYAIPLSSGNPYQGGSATVKLTFHAVQSGNNALPADCTAGSQCNTGGGFSWS